MHSYRVISYLNAENDVEHNTIYSKRRRAEMSYREGSLANGGNNICSATVTVDSDRCELLRLN